MKSHSTVLAKSSKYGLLSLTALLLVFYCKAQLCSGSLGDPVVNITFGSGSNPGGPLPSASTNYTYTTGICPNDGSYTVVNSTSGCFGNSWHTILEDHTPGDANGFMMLVNASVEPGVFYLDTVKNLCGGTTYEFSSWILNVLRPYACGGNGNRPNITFSIETPNGSVVQTYNTGDINATSSPQWIQYGFYFTLPTNVADLVLRMTNNAPGGCGNDLALDDITFRPCGPKVNASFGNIAAGNDTANFCVSSHLTVFLNASVQSGYANPAYQWQLSVNNGTTWTDIVGASANSYTQTFTSAGSFQFRVTAADASNINIARCRVASKLLTIIVDSIPVPHPTHTSPTCLGDSVTFTAKGGGQYAWTGPNSFSSALASPILYPLSVNNGGKYFVKVATPGGCVALDSASIEVNSLPVADAGISSTICEGGGTRLNATGGNNYLWSPPTGLSNPAIATPVASPGKTTTYSVKVTNQFQCHATDTVTVFVLKTPVADAGSDKKITEGQSVQLNGKAGGAYSSFFWTPPQFINNTATLVPVVNPTADIVYTLHVLSTNVCAAATDDVFVKVYRKIIIPNAFSPNGDGINDLWVITALNTYPESITEVFNRYGQVVFSSKGYVKAWDGTYNGKPLPVGTYYYIIDPKVGSPLVSGWVMIIR